MTFEKQNKWLNREMWEWYVRVLILSDPMQKICITITFCHAALCNDLWQHCWRCDAFIEVCLMNLFFWDTTPQYHPVSFWCSKGHSTLEMFGPIYPVMQCHIPEECDFVQILYNIGKIIHFIIIIIQCCHFLALQSEIWKLSLPQILPFRVFLVRRQHYTHGMNYFLRNDLCVCALYRVKCTW